MKKGFTLVEIMIVVAIIALLAALAIPNLLRSRLNASEGYAQATLRAISTAAESYAAAHEGKYPAVSLTADLFGADPKYINKDYVADCTAGSPCQGYSFAYTAAVTGYTSTATPQGALVAKAKSYSITTGGVLTGAVAAAE
ncbi:MAG: type II secretion system protein [Candidatus Omnitrophota bacterium]